MVLFRALWTLFFFGSLALCTYQVALRVMYYLEYPSVMSMETKATNQLPFPSVTLCNPNKYRYTSISLKRHQNATGPIKTMANSCPHRRHTPSFDVQFRLQGASLPRNTRLLLVRLQIDSCWSGWSLPQSGWSTTSHKLDCSIPFVLSGHEFQPELKILAVSWFLHP